MLGSPPTRQQHQLAFAPHQAVPDIAHRLAHRVSRHKTGTWHHLQRPAGLCIQRSQSKRRTARTTKARASCPLRQLADSIHDAGAVSRRKNARLSLWPTLTNVWHAITRVALSDLEPRFVCTACGQRGADIRPDFHWDKAGRADGNGRMSTSFLTWTSRGYPVTLGESVLGWIRRSITITYPTRCDQGIRPPR